MVKTPFGELAEYQSKSIVESRPHGAIGPIYQVFIPAMKIHYRFVFAGYIF